MPEPQFVITVSYFVLAFVLGLLPGSWGLMGFVFLVPISPNLHGQINSLFSLAIQAQANAGIDLAAGFFLGVLFQQILRTRSSSTRFSKAHRWQSAIQFLPPWPVALGLLVITASTVLAVVRNAWQSAAPISMKGLLFNFQHFRPMGWHDDFFPLAEWMAFALAMAAFISVMVKLSQIESAQEKNKVIFLPLMLGIIAAGLMGIIQARTGLGLLESSLEFRKDRIGYAAQGFQPDIHSFAAHMLIGVVGLWGYWYAFLRGGYQDRGHSMQRWILVVAMAIAWVGLILSKSRFSFLIAVLAITIGASIYLWRNHRRWFYPLAGGFSLLAVLALITLFAYSNQSSFWMIHLLSQLQERGFASITAVGGIFGDRPEIFSAAIRMFGSFPLMGLGLGDFFRMSSNSAFSQSALLSVRGGENAHNYFLQTLTETGIVGSLALAFALSAPLWFARRRSPLIPAAIALFAVLLGNVYAHSLLVRENLILLSILLGLMYSIYQAEDLQEGRIESSLSSPTYTLKGIVITCFCGILGFGAFVEVYRSFTAFPFQYGSACFVPKSLTADGWSSGKTMGFVLPAGAHGIRLPVEVTRPGITIHPLDANLQIIGYRWSVMASSNVTWNAAGKNVIEVVLPNGQVSDGSIDAVLTLSTCYTPRNQGVSVDGRRLGVLIRAPEFF
ncbi:O-antigen ligase family protein [Polynucleobacter sp. 15G-AUS-farblos]|uniref:O-antigen ligase family protein n=1 Tax=Polynucleobacter sp. 15G-AUS-farblos TaxID=2689094 RepID=UPI001C0D282D|nr:O-antigen ligase family protein [Polynucleobacter sp. 15G-AUS-farblos]MBU3583736.1 O-antigen ligase family protein [Polynucleobacter sp. 15G-AUS-farblos]